MTKRSDEALDCREPLIGCPLKNGGGDVTAAADVSQGSLCSQRKPADVPNTVPFCVLRTGQAEVVAVPLRYSHTVNRNGTGFERRPEEASRACCPAFGHAEDGHGMGFTEMQKTP